MILNIYIKLHPLDCKICIAPEYMTTITEVWKKVNGVKVFLGP